MDELMWEWKKEKFNDQGVCLYISMISFNLPEKYGKLASITRYLN